MNSDFIKIESALKNLVGRGQINELSEDNFPLFLLADLDPDVVAFAAVNGRPEEEYGKALERFKSLYADKGDAWAERDLTLVVCTHEGHKELSAYWNQVELDKYFCRKFVIDASDDVNNQLKRLPFVPLNPQRVVGLVRPRSAQTLLRRKHGLETWLADALAVAGGQSPKTIVRKSLATKDVPAFANEDMESFVGSPMVQQAGVRIKDLHIENFRAYCDQKFDFEADVIVLYGPNGLGKTSLFDAIDFLCTGGVTRFDERHPLDPKRLKPLNRLGTAGRQSRVTATLSLNGKEFQVSRDLSDATDAIVDGSTIDRRKTLIRLANLPKNVKLDLRVDNLIRLFRATHLFGQDSASLTSQIHNDSTIPQETVARMLAFQDYVEAISKSQKVSDEFSSMTEVEESRLLTTSDAVKVKQSEADNLSTAALSLETPEMISIKADDLAKEISAILTGELERLDEITPSIVQGWRGLLEGELNNLREQIAIAKDAEVRFPQLQELRALADNLTEQRDSEKRTEEKARTLLGDRQQKLYEVEGKRKELAEQQRGLTNQIEAISWLVTNTVEYRRLSLEVEDVNTQLYPARAESAQLIASCEKITAEVSLLENSTRQIQQQMRLNEKELSALNDLLSIINQWRQGQKRSDELIAAITTTTEKSREIENQVNKVSGQLQQASASTARALNALNTAQRSQTELQTLLDNLQQYVIDEVCPLCGHQHKDKTALLAEIDRQQGSHSETVTNALRQVEATKADEQALDQRLGHLQQSNVLLAADLNSLIDERASISARLEQYADQAIALGIIELTPDRCEQMAKARATVLEQNLMDNRQQFAAQSQLLKDKQNALADETLRSNQVAQVVIELEARHRAASNLVNQLKKKAANFRVDFEAAEGSSAELDRLNKQLRRTKLDSDAIREPSQKMDTEVKRLKSEIEQRVKQIRDSDSRLTAVRKSIAKVEQTLARLNLSLDAKAEEVGLFRMRLEERELALDNLRRRVIDFEIAMDASQTQAALAKMQDELTALRKVEADSSKRIDSLIKWRQYFDDIHDSLIKVQQTLLAEYVDKYGPLASKIQQRLRPVYGFGELKLQAEEEGSIAVTVERDGAQYLPSDYFSESQLQIVMLSLFLSAVLTQTWSSFGLILLDDPVTHFDDLNAYALLDVIRGLVAADSRHQFVVSTCEERLYRLMRQRFSKIKTDVAFYEFQSIGENGPVVLHR